MEIKGKLDVNEKIRLTNALTEVYKEMQELESKGFDNLTEEEQFDYQVLCDNEYEIRKEIDRHQPKSNITDDCDIPF